MGEVLILQHAACEAPGAIADAVAAAGLTARTVRGFAGEPVPKQADGLSGLVVLGGPQGVNEQEKYPFLKDELHLVEDALACGTPILGICLGSQMLAASLGAHVRSGLQKEIGWFPIMLSSKARSDPLFTGAGTEFTALHWHGDIFDLPSGAVHLAYSQQTSNQAFRYGSNAYGFLFHMEVTEAMLREWVTNFAGDLTQSRINGAEILRDCPLHLPPLGKVGATVFERWARLAAERA